MQGALPSYDFSSGDLSLTKCVQNFVFLEKRKGGAVDGGGGRERERGRREGEEEKKEGLNEKPCFEHKQTQGLGMLIRNQYMGLDFSVLL